MKKTITIISIFLLGITFLTSCNSEPTSLQQKLKYIISDSLLKTLRIDSVENCPIVNSLTLTGKVAFNEEKVARIFPMVSGNITNVKVQIGDHVNKGQRLGIIRSSEMAGYSNDLITSKTNVLIAKKNLDAAEDMYKGGLMSEKDFITAQQMYKQSLSQLNKSNEVLQINGGNTHGEYVLHAPISGFVVEKLINNDMSIRNDNNNSLFTISDLKNVWILANVYESNISKVHLGDDAEVSTLAYPGRIFRGKIDQILNVLDPSNKVMKIRVVLPNEDYALKPEMFANVKVISKSDSSGLCIPKAALIFDNSQYYVLIYKSPSDVKIVQVEVLGSNGGKSFISGSLHEGDKIISTNTILIYEALNN